jgi:hypothetical protein
MQVGGTNYWLAVGGSIALLCCYGVGQQVRPSQTLPLTAILEGMEQAQAGLSPQVSYQMIREYRLSSANDSKANSDVVAEVDFRPPASKKYRIQKSSGSDRGQQIVKRVLDHEVESGAKGTQSRAALNRKNYDFTYLGEALLAGRPCYRLALKPRRNEKDLIAGEAWVDKQSFLVHQVEGDLAKTPSLWLKKVHVKLQFADFDGTWLQTSMEAIADVRIVGPHTLTSRVLDYRGADEVAMTTTRAATHNRKR